MKQFSIHKVNKPVMRRVAAADDKGGDATKQDEFDQGDGAAGSMSVGGRREAMFGDQSLLTVEEQVSLQPKEIKVVNPWIHEATHKEYLESVKVSNLTSYLGRHSAPALLFKYYFLSPSNPK